MKKFVALLLLVIAVGSARAQCTNYTITVGGGLFDNEIDWELLNGFGVTVASGIAPQTVAVCLPADCYTMYMYDSFGDGWDGASWVMKVQPANTIVASGTLNNGSFGTAQVNLQGGCGGGNCSNYTLNVTSGSFPTEISWNLVNGVLIVSTGFAPSSIQLCLDTGCYVMQLFDSWGDGWNGATWTLVNSLGTTVNSGTLATGSIGQGIIDLSPTTACAPATAVTASDCPDAVNICTNYSWAIDPNGIGAINEIPVLGSIGNPLLDWGDGQLSAWGTDNYGCLQNNELNSTWMIVNISGGGSLEFTFGGLGQQAGFYDWIMYTYDATACADVVANTLAPVRCNWNGASWGGTGLASALPPGGNATNFEPPLNVVTGEQYLICFSNWSSVTTTVPLEFGGTATVSCDPVVLPVELLSFEAIDAGDAVLLEWFTASEESTARFEVHRSNDGATWQPIGSVAAAGTSQQTIEYAHLDMQPLNGLSYYRLHIIDTDGSGTYSEVVGMQRVSGNISAHPNPTDGTVTLGSTARLRVIDAQGRTMPYEVVRIGTHDQTIRLGTTGLFTVLPYAAAEGAATWIVVR
ncbi:MAG: hypothetical protein IPO17_07215 [Flavobacteriales bacterium]|nr:hypothetical protein [Flavobacteriales bacterium]